MTTGLKVWLWVVFVLNIISAVTSVFAAMLLPILWVSVVLEIVIIVGIGLLLFGQKKIGYYLVCAMAVLGLIVNVVLGTNIIYAVISAVLMPLITWLLMKNTWDQFE